MLRRCASGLSDENKTSVVRIAIIVFGFCGVIFFIFTPTLLKDRLVTQIGPPGGSQAHKANQIYFTHFENEAVHIAIMTSAVPAIRTCWGN
jgi:hypothetical protein